MRVADFNLGLHFVRDACAVSHAVYHFKSWTNGSAPESIRCFFVYIFSSCQP